MLMVLLLIGVVALLGYSLQIVQNEVVHQNDTISLTSSLIEYYKETFAIAINANYKSLKLYYNYSVAFYDPEIIT
jgi:hypothetical protein